MTYSELANFDIVETENLVFIAHAKFEDGNELADKVESAEDEACSKEGICASTYGIGKLVAELNPVFVNPSTFNGSVAVKVRNVVTKRGISVGPLRGSTWYLRCEKCGQNVSNKSTNSVNCEDV